MKILKWMVLMAVVIFLPALSHSATLGSLRVSLIEGDVQIQTEDTGDWVPASINMPLKDGDRIWVPEGGRMELQLRDGTVLRLDERTGLDILTLDQDSYQFYLPKGRAYANFRGARGSVLQIDTPTSSVRAYERAVFRIDLLDDRNSDISVYFGSIYAESQDGRTRVDADKTLALREGSPAELGPMGPPDEWEEWNRNRNQRFAERRAPSRYLPEELYPYSSDFEEHGRWVYVREYGHVWTPRLVVSAGWAPYRIGRWVWVGGDYVWISYEPWGWVPYHYGRWAFVASFGWCWVPPPRGAVFWGPGFVGWVRTPTHVSWVPLAPREIYYGYGHYGPHSVNLVNVNITTINVSKVVYRNIHVHNAVTVVHHDTFVHGRHVDVTVRENLFLRERMHIGRPDIKPQRSTVVPVLREIPQTKRPPEKIREIKVREIRERRPLAREQERSVLRPESPPREMTIKRRESGSGERGVDRARERSGISPTRELEKPGDRRPAGRIEKPGEARPPERRIEKPVDRVPGQQIQPPREERRPAEPQKGPSVEKSVPDRGKSPVREREIQKPPEQRPPERGRDIQRESRPERGVERPQEIKPPVREIEKPGQTPPPGSQGVRPPDRGSSREVAPSRGEQRPQPRVEKPQETRPPVREIEKPGQAPPPGSQGVRPPDRGSSREVAPSRGEKKPEPELKQPQEQQQGESGSGRQKEPGPSDSRGRDRNR
jgi:hypothetical protein